MKKIFISVIAIIIAALTMFMGGCAIFDGLFEPSDNEDADNKLQAFVQCLDNEDREGIRSLFAQNKTAALTDFDKSVEELLLYYDGESISVERHSTGVEEDKDGEKMVQYVLRRHDGCGNIPNGVLLVRK